MFGAGAAVSITPEAGEDSPSGASARGPHHLAAIATCDRMWALRYFWFFRQRASVEARVNPWRLGGTLIHTCREYYFASLMHPGNQPGWFRKKSLHERLHEQAPKRPDLIQMALKNIAHYMEWSYDDRVSMNILSIEGEYQATLGELDPGGPWPELDNDIISCRSDLVYSNPGGDWVLDYKSLGRSRVNKKTGRLKSWRDDGEFALNWQSLINLHIIRRRRGPQVRGFIIERTTRQEPWDHDRHVLIVPQMAYDEAPRAARRLIKREYDLIAELEAGGRPAPSYHACYGRFGPCDYRDVCLAKDKAQMYERLLESFESPSEEEVRERRMRLRVVQ